MVSPSSGTPARRNGCAARGDAGAMPARPPGPLPAAWCFYWGGVRCAGAAGQVPVGGASRAPPPPPRRAAPPPLLVHPANCRLGWDASGSHNSSKSYLGEKEGCAR